MTFRRKGEKVGYNFIDSKCIGRTCWQPGLYRHSGDLSNCCLQRAYRGCPDGPVGEIVDPDGSKTCGLPLYDESLAASRRKEGWLS